MEKVKRLELWWQPYLYVTSGLGLSKKTTDGFFCVWVSKNHGNSNIYLPAVPSCQSLCPYSPVYPLLCRTVYLSFTRIGVLWRALTVPPCLVQHTHPLRVRTCRHNTVNVCNNLRNWTIVCNFGHVLDICSHLMDPAWSETCWGSSFNVF
jgi:hypothetical protein